MANQIKFKVGFDVDKTNLNQLKSQLQQIQKLSISDVMKINNTNATQAKDALVKIKTQALNVETALKTAFNVKLNTINIETFNQSLKKSGSSIEQVYSTFRAAGTAGENAFRSLSSQVLSTNIQLKETHNILDKMATTFANTVKWNISSAAFNTMTNSVQQAWNFTKALDSSLNDIRIVTGKSADEMADFAVKANEAARALGESTKDYTNASLIFAQQGLSDEQIEARTAITLKTANVTGQTAEKASEQLTAVWNGYKVSAEEAEIYVDRLAAIAAKSASDLEELSTGMSKVASAAATMGVTEEQLASQLSTIISVTRQAPQTVGTALKTVYARISDIQAGLDEEGVSLGNYSGKMAEFGINVLDSSGKLRDMGQVIEEIGGKWGTMTREQQVALTQTMGGQRQYSNLVALFDNFDQYTKMMEVAANAQGTLQEQQDIYMDRTTTHLQQLSTAAEEFYMSLVDNEGINGLIDGLTGVIDLTTTWIQSIGGAGTLLTGLGGIGLNVFSEQIAKGINTMISNSEKANSNVKQIQASLQEVQKWQGIPELDNFTKQLLDSREEMLELAHLMSPEQFAGIQNSLNDLTQAGNAVAELTDKREKLDAVVKRTLGKRKSLEEGLEDSKWQEGVLENFSKYEIELNHFKKIAKESAKELSELRIEFIDDEDVENFKERIVDLNSRLDSVFDKSFNKKLIPESQLKNFEKLEKDFKNLNKQLWDPNANIDEIAGKLQLVYAKINGIITNSADGIEQTITDLKDFFENGSEQMSMTLDEAIEKAEILSGQLETAARTELIEGFSKLGGSILQIGSAIQQIQNIGSIWQNNDLSTGEKILQTFIALGTIIPTLVSGLTGFKQAIDLINKSEATRAEVGKAVAVTEDLKAKKSKEAAAANVAETVSNKAEEASEESLTIAKLKQQLATGKATIASGLHSAAEAVETAATGVLTGATEALNLALTTLAANPIFLVIGGAAIVLGGIAAGIAAYNKNIENTIKNNKELIEQENEKQQQLKKNEELYSSLEELNNQYQNNQIALSDLKEKTQELLESYKIEDELVQRLTRDYGQYSKVLSEFQKENLKAQYQSSKIEKAKAEENLKLIAKGGFFDNRTELFGKLSLKTGRSFKEDPELDKILLEAGYQKRYGVQESSILAGASSIVSTPFVKTLLSAASETAPFLHQYSLEITNDADSIQQAYEKMEKAVSKMTYEQRQTAAGKELIKTLQDLKEASETYGDSVEKTALATVKYRASMMDFSEISSISDYAKTKEQLSKQTSQYAEVSEEEGKKAAVAYLRTYKNTLYKDFEIKSKILQKIQGDSKQGLQALDKMSEQQLEIIEGIDFSNWEEFLSTAKGLEKIDLSNLKVATITDGQIDAAKDQYDFYNSLSEQIASSKKQTISAKQWSKLSSEIQKFFVQTADGTYKLKGDLIEFYDIVNKKSQESFKNISKNLNIQQERLIRLTATMAKVGQGQSKANFNANILKADRQTQLDFLLEQGWDKKQIIEWSAQLKELGDISKDSFGAFNEALNETLHSIENSDQAIENYKKRLSETSEQAFKTQYELGMTATSLSELKKMWENNEISVTAYNAAYIDLKKQLENEIFDPKEVSAYADYLQEIAQDSAEFSNDLKNNRKDALELAKDTIKLNTAIETLGKNWEDWSDILRNSSSNSVQYQQALKQTISALSLMLGIDEEFIDDDFVQKHLNEIGKAAQGNEKAIESLKDSLSEEIIANIIARVDPKQEERLKEEFKNLEELAQKDLEDIKIGATLESGDFLDALNKIIDSTDITVGQVNGILQKVEMEPDFETTKESVQQEIPETETRTILDLSSYGYVKLPGAAQGLLSGLLGGEDGIKIPLPTVSTETYETGKMIPKGSIEVPSLGVNSKAPRVRSLRKKAPSSTNNYSTKNKGGKSSSGKSSSGKKGGGGSSNKADTSQKDLKKPLEDERDIYHDINIELEQINRELDRTQKTQDRLYGKPLLDNLNKQSQILENHKTKLKEKQKIQEQDLVNQRSILKSLGVTFDAYGNIANYMDILAQKQNNINQLTKEYNKLVESYNASTNKDTKTKINEKIEAKNKEIQEEEEARKNLEDKIKGYDDLREAMEDLVDEIEDETQQQIEIAITKFRMQLEIRLDMGQAEKDWNEFRRKVINNTNILKDSDFDQLFKDAKTNVEDLLSYFDVHGSQGSIAQLTKQLAATRGEIEAIDKTGESAIYGDNKAQAMEDLHSDLDELMGQMKSIQDLIDEIDEAYLDTIDDIKDQFDEQIEGYELVADIIEHDMDLLTLLYGNKNYDAMSKYYDTLQANQNNQLDSLKQQRDYWRVQWEEAVARGDTQAAQKLKENYTNVLKDLNSLIEESAQTLQDKYTNAIEKIFDELDKKISGGKGIDYLELEQELMNKNADEYLDTINSAFKLQDLQTKFTKALNDTKSLKGQKEIKRLMDEQLSNLKTKDKLTEYDVQRAEKLLQIEQARIALEDAQSAKTTMRLKRDSQGNYSYQFVANDDDILEAQQNLANAQNDLYNFDKERYQANLNDMISAWKDFQSQYKEIQLDTSLTEEERVRKLALLREEYGQYINNKVAENEVIRGNLMDSAFADYAALYDMNVENYQGMSDKEKNILMNELVPVWDSGVQHMVDTFAGEGGFVKVCEEAFKHLDEVAKTHTSNLSQLFSNAGISADALKEGTDNLVEGLSDLVEKNDDLINRMKTELSAVEGLRNSAKDLMAQYNGVYEAAKKMTSAIHEYYQEQQKQAAETAKKEATTKPTTPTSATTKPTTPTSATKKQNTAKTTTKKQNTAKTTTKKQNTAKTTTKKQNTAKTVAGKQDTTQTNDNLLSSIILTGGKIVALGALKAKNQAEYAAKTKKQVSTKLQAKAVAESIGTKTYSQVNTPSFQSYLKSKYSGSYKDYLKSKIKKYDSGGYTGEWPDNEGRLALLHKKELVLNSSDTENMLNMVNITREILKSLNNNAFTRISNINNLTPRNENSNDTIEQNIRIEASFPNVDSKREIEEAFNDLVNLAAQRAMKR